MRASNPDTGMSFGISGPRRTLSGPRKTLLGLDRVWELGEDDRRPELLPSSDILVWLQMIGAGGKLLIILGLIYRWKNQCHRACRSIRSRVIGR